MLLETADTCWKIARADRFAVLMENELYFRAVCSALDKAQRSILLLGWQFDPRTRLDPNPVRRHHTDEIGHMLRRLVRERPELKIKMLIWRMPLPIAWSQDFFPQRSKAWFRNKPIDFRLDRAGPVGACHHQKVLVVDDRIAFCGGGDISTDRWDTALHLDREPRRMLPRGMPYAPRHEVMTLCSGPAARALGSLFRARWLAATGEGLAELSETDLDGHDPWPDGVAPDLTDIDMALARTAPAWRGRVEHRENERLHLRAIAQARSLIYLENQYVTSPLIGAALAARLEEKDGPEVAIVSHVHSPSWFDQATMDRSRNVLLARLREADRYGRLSAWAPRTTGGKPIIVHSKLTLIDDRLLRVGSTNLNNRSGGFDTECDVALEAKAPTDRLCELIRTVRAHELGHFLGVEASRFEAAYRQAGTIAGAIGALNLAGRLIPLGGPPTPLCRFIARTQLGDPASSADSWRPWRRLGRSELLRDAARAEPSAVAPESAPLRSGR